MSHWATDYIGSPWVAGEHDCWAFARRVWRERFGLDVPAVDVDALDRRASMRAWTGHPEAGHWQRVDHPHEGDACLMGKSGRPSHVGIWIEADGGGVLHCVEGRGVILNDRTSLALCGWRVLGWYRRFSA